MRLLPNWIQSISKHISADANIRPMLAWIHITDTHVSATDSFMAIRSELPKKESHKYVWENVESLPEEWIIVPSVLIDKIKFIPNKNVDALDKNAVIRTLDDANISIVVSDLDTEVQYTSRILKWKFPDVEAFHKSISESTKKEEIAFNIQKMQDMLATLKAMWFENLKLSTHEVTWIVLKPYNTQEDTWGLVMPLKI